MTSDSRKSNRHEEGTVVRPKGCIVAGALAPHPPHLVYGENPPQNEPRSECGWEELRWGYERLRKEIPSEDYDVILVHTPHWTTTAGHHFLAVPKLSGISVDPVFPNLFRYQYDLKVDVELASQLSHEAQEEGLITSLMKNPHFRVDYGTIISCHLVNPKWDKPIVAISSNTAFYDYGNDVGQDQMLKLGRATRRAVEKLGRRALCLASCSLSHRHFTTESDLPEDMTQEHVYHQGQYLWDMRMINLMKQGNTRELIDIMPDFIESAMSECKAGSLSWLMATLDYPSNPAMIHAYGSVIGTGNAIVSWKPRGGES